MRRDGKFIMLETLHSTLKMSNYGGMTKAVVERLGLYRECSVSISVTISFAESMRSKCVYA